MIFENILLVLAGTLTALLSGLFLGFAVAVNQGLGRLKDAEYVAAMKSINSEIQNPAFFIVFLGPVILLPMETYLAAGAHTTRFVLLLAASLLYIAGSVGLTAFGNVPLNKKLEKFDHVMASDIEIASARAQFETPWNRLHVIRTVVSIAATVLILSACLSD